MFKYLRKKSVLKSLGILFSICVVVFIVIYLSKIYTFLQNPEKKAFDAIPADVSFIVKCRNFDAVKALKEEKQDYLSVFLSEKGKENLENLMLLTEENPYLTEISSLCPLYISSHLRKKELEHLFIVEVGKKHESEIKILFSHLQNLFSPLNVTYKKNTIHALAVDSSLIYYTYIDGLLIVCSNEMLIRSSLEKSYKEDKKDKEKLHEITPHLDENTSFHLLIHLSQIYKNSKENALFPHEKDKFMEILSQCSWAGLDIAFAEKNIIGSGYLLLDKQGNFFKHRNNDIAFEKQIPAKTSHLSVISAENFKSFKKLYTQSSNDTEDFLELMRPTNIKLFQTKIDFSTNNFIALTSENISEASFHLFNSLNSSFEDGIYHLDTFYIGTSMIGKINIPNFMLLKLGIGNDIKRFAAYTIVENDIIFSDNDTSLIYYINAMKTKSFITQDTLYASLEKYFPTQSNWLFYRNNTITEQPNYRNSFVKNISSQLNGYRIQLNYNKEKTMYFSFAAEIK